MKSNKILIHVANLEMLDNIMDVIQNTELCISKVSTEIMSMINLFLNKDWEIYLTIMSSFDYTNLKWKIIYDCRKKQLVKRGMSIEQANELVDLIIIRVIGSVESNRDEISKYVKYLNQNYNKQIINNENSFAFGMRKDYLLDMDKSISSIPTDYYPKSIDYKSLILKYRDNLDNYIIKPITGELSNSICVLSQMSQEFLDHKKNKVGGWLVQPIMHSIWNGEYQAFFIGNTLSHANVKKYNKTNDEEILPNQKNRVIKEYKLSFEEKSWVNNVRQHFFNRYNIYSDICRVDFIKDNNDLILLEFETVNPGLFLKYISKKRRDQILMVLYNYCVDIVSKDIKMA